MKLNHRFGDVIYQMLIEIKREKEDVYSGNLMEPENIRKRKRYNQKCRMFESFTKFAASLLADASED